MEWSEKLWNEKITWNERLSEWGEHLRGLAQGGLYYGEGGEADTVRYRRMREIAQSLLEGGEAAGEEQLAAVAADLRGRVPSLTQEQADALARELIQKKEAVAEDQVRAWGAELAEMAEARLAEDLENLYDIGRFEAVRDLGRKMRDLEE